MCLTFEPSDGIRNRHAAVLNIATWAQEYFRKPLPFTIVCCCIKKCNLIICYSSLGDSYTTMLPGSLGQSSSQRVSLQNLADLITDTEQQHPDSVLIILGDFNKANLSCELPKYRQHVTCPTGDSNMLDHCYTTIKDAFHCPTDSFRTL